MCVERQFIHSNVDLPFVNNINKTFGKLLSNTTNVMNPNNAHKL